jgi:nitroimidazol reductase NimA-like FMN-containing flavoprotein (pyridoxamine 5'-phosphate oxidase superfamily)
MRREDKEIRDKNVIEAILQESDHCVIGISHNNSPYTVPMNFGFKDNNLYIHSSSEGRKIEILKVNNKVSFSVEIKTELVKSFEACNWGMKYMSVMGFGFAHFIEDINKKIDALDIIMNKYSKHDLEAPFQYSETAINDIVVIKVEVIELTGKKSGY